MLSIIMAKIECRICSELLSRVRWVNGRMKKGETGRGKKDRTDL